MALDSRFLDDLKHRLTLSDVIGRKVKLVRKGREHEGLCPFHNEKTPSFTVNDQKGFYHCFGCGAHGSVFDFVMETEGLGFREAVEALAGEAGLEMPKESREEAQKAAARKSLTEVMEVVTDWYAAQLHRQVGQEALAYLRRRGLSDAAIETYRIGYAPASRTALKDDMAQRGIPEEDLVATGMLIKPDEGPRREAYDRFRDRVMFPIPDRQGRVIAFGGRALDPEAKAKYLNSPETQIFHKGATLYNWARAREASYKTGQVMVVEGYMDVIALGEAGIDHAVAPLGTALTEEQLQHLWQMGDEPILAFDGDNAGRRAASRAAERALPLLKPGKSLRFVFLPDGQDPDDLVRAEGKAAIEHLCDGAEPLSAYLWATLTEGVVADTPERRAGFEKSVFQKLGDIADETIKSLYMRDFRSRIWDHFKGARTGGGGRTPRTAWGKRAQPAATGLLKRTMLGRTSGAGADMKNTQAVMLLTLAHHPELLVRFEEDVARLDIADSGLAGLRDVLVGLSTSGKPLDPEGVLSHIGATDHGRTLEGLKSHHPKKACWPAWPEAALSDAMTYFEQALARFRYLEARDAFLEAEQDFAANMTEENQQRFLAAKAAYDDLEDTQASIVGFGLESNRVTDA